MLVGGGGGGGGRGGARGGGIPPRPEPNRFQPAGTDWATARFVLLLRGGGEGGVGGGAEEGEDLTGLFDLRGRKFPALEGPLGGGWGVTGVPRS